MRLWGIAIASLFLAACQTTTGGSPETKLQGYSSQGVQKIALGAPIDTPYILDVDDIDGDGADDFAVSAKLKTRANRYISDDLVRSHLVHNTPSGFVPYDLGDAGQTRRTWTADFYRRSSGGPGYLVLGRNGETGVPIDNKGERTSVFRIDRRGSGLSIRPVFTSRYLGTTGNVAVCDIDRNGTPEIFVNNVAGFFGTGREEIMNRVYHLNGDRVTEASYRRYFPSIYQGLGGSNFIELTDMDGDGDCDALVAFESYKQGAPQDPDHRGRSDLKAASYVIPNRGSALSGPRIDLPNPAFGRDNSAFGIGTTRVRGEIVIIVTSSRLISHEQGFKGFALQAYALRGGRFVEVTKETLVGALKTDSANQAFVKFADIDGDGDDDFYLTLYGAGSPITVFLQEGSRFVATTIQAGRFSGQKAVGYLSSPGKTCMDLAVFDSSARLHRFSCQ